MPNKYERGFTFIELMTVVAVIGILAAIAIPQFSVYREKAWLAEAHIFAGEYRKDVLDYYQHTGVLPKNNAEAGLAAPEKIIGVSVTRLEIKNGVIIVSLKKDLTYHDKNTMKLRPIIQSSNPTGNIIWSWDETSE